MGTLFVNTTQNMRDENHCLAITTWSGKETIDPSMLEVDEVRDDVIDVDEEPKRIQKIWWLVVCH